MTPRCRLALASSSVRALADLSGAAGRTWPTFHFSSTLVLIGRTSYSSNAAQAGEQGYKADLSAKNAGVDLTPPGEKTAKAVVWWKPDPVTGCWVPEDAPSGIDTQIKKVENRRLTNTWSKASLDERAWWNSLEEIPEHRS